MTEPPTTPAQKERLISELVEEGDEVGAVLVTTNDGSTDVYARTEPGRDARWVALWMLGAYIHHITETARGSGGNATMQDTALNAVKIIKDHSGP